MSAWRIYPWERDGKRVGWRVRIRFKLPNGKIYERTRVHRGVSRAFAKTWAERHVVEGCIARFVLQVEVVDGPVLGLEVRAVLRHVAESELAEASAEALADLASNPAVSAPTHLQSRQRPAQEVDAVRVPHTPVPQGPFRPRPPRSRPALTASGW